MTPLRYRPEIDGLRAVAVMSVIVDHARFKMAGVPLLGGGYLGVDVFFVISGYLITLILLKAMGHDDYSLLHFWERRIRRIIPALALVLLVSFPFAWWLLFPAELEDHAGSALATLGFVSNFWFWGHTDYWAAASLTMPLLHTWSLAVEEQFYLLYPLLLLGLFRWRVGAIPILLAIVAVLSLLVAEFWYERDSAATFYLLPTRAWELACGALLACLEFRRGRKLASGVARYGPWAGLVLLVPCFVLFNEFTRHPSLLTVVPIVGTCLLIWCCSAGSPVTAMLASRPFVAVGKISYGLYLWHFPIFAFGRTLQPDPGFVDRLVWFALALLLASASYRFVERPSRNPEAVAMRPLLLAIGAAGLLIAGASILVRGVDGAPGRFAEFSRTVDLDYWAPESGHRTLFETWPGCWIDGVEERDFDRCRAQESDAAGPLVMVIGDSHLAGLVPGLVARYGRESVRQRIGNGCCERPSCRPALDSALAEVATLRPALILVGGNVVTTGDIEGVAAYARALQAAGDSTVMLVGPLPRWSTAGGTATLPVRLAEHYRRHRFDYHPPAWLEPDPITFELEARSGAAALAAGLPYLSVVAELCEGSRCRARTDGTPVGITSFDSAHLTHTASGFLITAVADRLDPILLPAGR